jgi:hypothetical protein
MRKSKSKSKSKKPKRSKKTNLTPKPKQKKKIPRKKYGTRKAVRDLKNKVYLGKRGDYSEELNKSFSINKVFNEDSLNENNFKFQMNKLMDYPRNLKLDYLTSLKDITSLKGSYPESILITTFGYEREFINFLLENSKVFSIINLLISL